MVYLPPIQQDKKKPHQFTQIIFIFGKSTTCFSMSKQNNNTKKRVKKKKQKFIHTNISIFLRHKDFQCT